MPRLFPKSTRTTVASPGAVRAWAADQRGNFTVLFALSAVTLMVLVGMGIDYYTGLSTKARLNSAADAAALATVNTAKAYFGAKAGTIPDQQLIPEAEQVGVAQGLNVFAANVGSTQLAEPIVPTITPGYDAANLQFTASVQWSGSVDAHFGPLVGISTLALGGTSGALASLPKFLDFYVLTDVSGSMGIPTSAADQQTLILTNPDNAQMAAQYPSGCQFACHFPGYSGFAYTQQPAPGKNPPVLIPLKLNTVGSAIQGLLNTALSTSTASGVVNEFRVGIYPFIVHAIQAVGLSADLTQSGAAFAAANNLQNYIDNGTSNNGMGSGGTHFEYLWNDMTSTSYLQSPGTGLGSTSRLPFIIMVTDGVDNSQTYGPFSGSWPQLPDTTSNASFCTLAKNAGYTVAVLFIPYSPIVDPQAIWNDEDAAVNYVIDPTTYPPPPSPYAPKVPAGDNASVNMSNCASKGYFFSAGTAAEINAAMQTIFYQAVAQSRLTQ
jgi:hypothetical protein